ncbi:MAG: hypothetical protein QNJ44_10005 [Rhodobacter sp.]|nr:hypothetical protein [Rhodobacter sp.]
MAEDVSKSSLVPPGPGHNNGPTLEPGRGWRAHCWGKARRELLPRLPVEVVRIRVKRAAEIGLDYRTYATVRASTGRDIVAFLFSTNALRLFREHQALEAERAARLAAVTACQRRALVISPLQPMPVLKAVTGAHGAVLDAAHAAPCVHAGWADTVRDLTAARGAVPADAVLLVGDTATEREWSAAGRLAGYLPAERFFGGASP